METAEQIHQQAKVKAKTFRTSQAELLEVIIRPA